MYYIVGKIILKKSNFLIIENNKIGYKLFTYHLNNVPLNKTIKIYIYEYFNNSQRILLGIHSIEHFDVIKKLIKKRGTGIITLIKILNKYNDFNEIIFNNF